MKILRPIFKLGVAVVIWGDVVIIREFKFSFDDHFHSFHGFIQRKPSRNRNRESWRFDWPVFLRALGNRPDKSPRDAPMRCRTQRALLKPRATAPSSVHSTPDRLRFAPVFRNARSVRSRTTIRPHSMGVETFTASGCRNTSGHSMLNASKLGGQQPGLMNRSVPCACNGMARSRRQGRTPLRPPSPP